MSPWHQFKVYHFLGYLDYVFREDLQNWKGMFIELIMEVDNSRRKLMYDVQNILLKFLLVIKTYFYLPSYLLKILFQPIFPKLLSNRMFLILITIRLFSLSKHV